MPEVTTVSLALNLKLQKLIDATLHVVAMQSSILTWLSAGVAVLDGRLFCGKRQKPRRQEKEGLRYANGSYAAYHAYAVAMAFLLWVLSPA